MGFQRHLFGPLGRTAAFGRLLTTEIAPFGILTMHFSTGSQDSRTLDCGTFQRRPQNRKSDELKDHLLSAAVANKVKWKVAPCPGTLVTQSLPPCDSTIERLTRSPMPVPWGFVVKNASKMWSA